MIGFYHDPETDGAWSIDNIKSISPPSDPGKHGSRYRVARRRDDTTFQIHSGVADAILRRPVQLMPCQPGTMLCHIEAQATEPHEVFFTPMVAWAICADGEIRPVTPAGVNDGLGEPNEGWYVKMPDGKICSANAYADHCAFDSADELSAHFAAEARKRRPAQEASA
ncbi:hypothetical protein [uncultured Sphingomonas sp.]|uniref:hypothetical protein n=1 Tax=uncultured Sphingomonas sp. TaxID=158754 RepID=UPI0025EB2480|nr:hypothetical protein [uncultured Sphingomonas sp.]